MKRREFLGFGGLTLLTLAESSCSSQLVNISELEKLFDQIEINKKKELRRHIKGIQENMVTFSTSSKFYVSYYGTSGLRRDKFTGEGIICGNYILTANHVINLTEEEIIKRLTKILEEKGIKFDPDKFMFNKIDEYSSFDGTAVKKALNFPEKDMGIVPYYGPKKSNYKVQLGDSDKLKVLDQLYVVGRPRSRYPVVKEGMVGSRINKKIYDVVKGEIITDHEVVGGDSGSPLINSDGEVVGIISTIGEDSHTISIPINFYKEAIAKYEVKLMVESRF